MIKKHKNKKRVHNQGNSYIMVVATLSFLAVLVAAMLVAVALCYRLKAYDINTRDNFYYLEQAMDEIYAGVGGDAMKHLNTAYDDTIEILVFFDAKTQSYITMDDTEANTILKNTYITLVKNDTNYKIANVENHLESFLSNLYNASSNKEGVQLSLDNVVATTDDLTIKNLVLKREAVYSTINTKKKAAGDSVAAGDTFVQTITTDLVISKPEFEVKFNTIDSDLSDLYDFAFVADKGIEIGDATTKINISGNIYAASDFYNKDYNETDGSDPMYAPVSNYEATEARTKNANGKNEKSMYSGLYINGADVVINADRIIVPGTIAAFNSANLTIAGSNESYFNYSEIWADGIVLGGYSFKASTDPDDKTVQGSVVKIRGQAYISDDLELNAESANFALTGQYYGYNYASLDNRTFTDEFIAAQTNRTFVDETDPEIADGRTLEGQAHYNSSSIIVNGENSSLDLSGVSDMYIAGQSYIETSKKTTKHDKVVDADGNETTDAYQVTNKNMELEAVSYNTFDYEEKSKDPTTSEEDNYTTNTAKVENKEASTNLQDYRTGEAISIKSNQLAYIPNWAVTDTEEGLYLNLPARLRNLDIFKDNWQDLSKIPVIKSVVSGKTYYFFDFSTASTYNETTRVGIDKDVMNQFIANYAEMFKEDESGVSEGDSYGLTDITDYEHFQIQMLTVKENAEGSTNVDGYDSIYSNSAITVKEGTTFTIKAKSSSITPLMTAARNINENIAEQNKFIDDSGTKRTDTVNTQNVTASVLAQNVTTKLQSQYKEVKWTLSSTSNNPQGVSDAHSMDESAITPINHFFFFNKLSDSWNDKIVKLNSGYKVWICKGDVEVSADGFAGGNVKGLVICKGDVTFADNVNSFEGLIVTGSKVKINRSINFMANAEIVKTILRECDESQQYTDTSKNHYAVCELFQQYQSVYKPNPNSGKVETESTKSISSVQFEDILSFNNWKKNVD